MDSSEKPTFHCTKLQDAFTKSVDAIDGYERKFDQMSDDIKALESYLSQRNIRKSISRQVHFEVNAGGGSHYPMEVFTENGSASIREDFSGTPGRITSYSLVWDEVEWPGQKKRFRLQYERTEIDGELQLDKQGLPYIDKPKSRVTDRLALIESPLEMRLKMRQYLPEFVEYLASKLD